MSDHSEEELLRQFEQIQGRIGQLHSDLAESEKRKVEILRAIFAARGISAGMTVEYRGAEYVIHHVDAYTPRSMVSMYGHKRKKNGALSERITYCGIWLEPTKEAAAE